MPYIKQEDRKTLDVEINQLLNVLSSYDIEDRSGLVNYTITRIVANALKPKDGWRYKWLNIAYGTFHSAASEFYRKLVAPYEDTTISKNGDLEEYN